MNDEDNKITTDVYSKEIFEILVDSHINRTVRYGGKLILATIESSDVDYVIEKFTLYIRLSDIVGKVSETRFSVLFFNVEKNTIKQKIETVKETLNLQLNYKICEFPHECKTARGLINQSNAIE